MTNERKKEILDHAKAGLDYVDKHKWLILAGLTLITAIVSRGEKKMDADISKYRIYDTSAGHYWELRKALKNSDHLEIEARKKTGETLGEILSSMGVLKK